MRALILAAGRGERMLPLTATTPKPLLHAGGKALVEWHIEKLAALGIEDIVVNIAHLAEQFPATLGDGSRWGVRLHWSREGAVPLETGGGVLHALPLLGAAPFLLVNGDVWCDLDFSTLPREPVGVAHLVMVDHVNSGKILFRNKDIIRLKPFKRALEGIGYVPQGREIIPLLTVNENLELGAMGHADINIEEKKKWVLEYFPALRVHLNRNGGVLSGGLQQQLAIARCLMGEPEMILLDEPTEGIQPNVVIEIADILKRIAEETGIAIVVVEQNLKFARRLAEEYVIIQKGSVVSKGAMTQLNDDVIKKYLSV